MKTQTRTCYFCDTKEGDIRPVGGFEVELKPVKVEGSNVFACQSCHRKIVRIVESENIKTGLIMDIKKLLMRILPLLIISFVFVTLAHAQGGPPGLPGFPDSPDAAPIDGGLSLLAAAGGAYAWKKLRDKKEH